jgi:hypothetical protein
MRSGGIDPLFLTLALDGGEWSVSRPRHFTLGERSPGTHWTGDWVGPTEEVWKLWRKEQYCACTESNPVRPARSYPNSEPLNFMQKFSNALFVM